LHKGGDETTILATVSGGFNGAGDALGNAMVMAAAEEMLEHHKENARILRLLVNELHGRIEAGKLAAVATCLGRSESAVAKATGTIAVSQDDH
jgi:hypothetical protein